VGAAGGAGGGGGGGASGGGGGGGADPDASAEWQRGVIERIVAVLFEYRFELAAAFSLFDTDRSGKISRDELRIGLNSISSLTGSPLTEGQADELMRALDTNGDGEIDWAEFVNAFRLVDTGAAAAAAGKKGLGGRRKSSRLQLVKPPAAAGAGAGAGAGAR